jgi:hypothetical protein
MELERTAQLEAVAAVIDIDVAEFGKGIAERRLIGALREGCAVHEQQRGNEQNSHVFLPSDDGSASSQCRDYPAILTG